MKRSFFFVAVLFCGSPADAAEVAIEACVSTPFTEAESGDAVAGFASTCYPLEGRAEIDENIGSKSARDQERREFFVGVCNDRSATQRFIVSHELKY